MVCVSWSSQTLWDFKRDPDVASVVPTHHARGPLDQSLGDLPLEKAQEASGQLWAPCRGPRARHSLVTHTVPKSNRQSQEKILTVLWVRCDLKGDFL